MPFTNNNNALQEGVVLNCVSVDYVPKPGDDEWRALRLKLSYILMSFTVHQSDFSIQLSLELNYFLFLLLPVPEADKLSTAKGTDL